MRRGILLAFAGSLALFIAHCANSPSENQTEGSESKSVRIAIKTPAKFDTVAASARVRVSANDMSTIIEQPLSILDTQISGVVHQIPVGYNRKFEVFVYGYDSSLRYYGSAYANIFANDTTLVSIILRKPNGTAIISGYIEDMIIPRDSISQPTTPYIDSIETDSITPHHSIIHLRTNCCISYDSSIGFKWSFWGFNPATRDSNYYVLNGTTRVIDSFPADGIYRVTVQGYYYQNPQITSPVSNMLVYVIKNGLLIDTIVQTDSIPPVLTLIGSDSIHIALQDSFFDPGARAYDNVDGDITSRISKSGNINISVSGTYLIHYNVTDRAGNSASIVRMVIVTGTMPDRIAPVITLLGSQLIHLSLNDTFVEPGFTAYDNVDGNITSKVTTRFLDSVDNGSLRIRTIIYSVKDAAGNMATTNRQIIYSPEETVSQPAKPFVVNSMVVKSPVYTRTIEFATNSVVTSSRDSVFYDWTIKSPNDTTASNIQTTTLFSIKYTFKNKGLYAIMVRARCRIHSDVQSQNSAPLWINISDSTAVDSILVVR